MITNGGKDFQCTAMFSTGGAQYIALTSNATAPAATDTVLTGEITTAGSGLIRAIATYAHTAGTGLATLTKTFTTTASDAASTTINKAGSFVGSSGGAIVFETAMPNPPVLGVGDSTAVTWNYNL